MNFLEDMLRNQVAYNFHEATPDTKDFITNTAKAMVKDWLLLFKEYLPPADASEHAKGAHDAVSDLETWINHKDQTVEDQ